MAFAAVGDNTIDEYVGAQERSFVGGNAVNVAVRIAELGGDVAYFGAVGMDERGERVRDALAGRGVVVEHLLEIPGTTSTSQVRVEPSGERHLSGEDFGTCADYKPTEAELDAMAARGVVHVGWTPVAGEVRAGLRRRGAIVSQDCAVADGFDNLDVAFCSTGVDQDAAAAAVEAIAGGARLVVVTRGAAGSIAFDGTRWWSHEAVPIDVVDTTGAGDSFIAGFLLVWGRGGSVADSMAAGAAAAAETCQHHGGFRQVPW